MKNWILGKKVGKKRQNIFAKKNIFGRSRIIHTLPLMKTWNFFHEEEKGNYSANSGIVVVLTFKDFYYKINVIC